MSTTIQKGLTRDNQILIALEEYGALDTDQIRSLLFRNMQYGQRKTQERLLSLLRREKVSRSRNGTYIYTLYGDARRQLEHTVGVNWVRLHFELCSKSWEHLHSFEYERDYMILRHDGFAAIKNTVTGKFRFIFVELDRGTNRFDKVSLYNKLYDSAGYGDRWWVKLSDRFPAVLIVTTLAGRLKQIEQRIREDNSCGLEFQVRLLEDVRREVMSKCLSPTD